MAVVEKFLGKSVRVPKALRYISKPGLWANSNEEYIIFGLTEPALVLAGGFNDLDWLVPNGQTVSKGEAVIFCITAKILYIDAPITGTIHFNENAKQNTSIIVDDPYGNGWMFKIKSKQPLEEAFCQFVSADDYIQSLKETDGHKNPDGLIGGVSGICKAVYSGIREQKF